MRALYLERANDAVYRNARRIISRLWKMYPCICVVIEISYNAVKSVQHYSYDLLDGGNRSSTASDAECLANDDTMLFSSCLSGCIVYARR